MPNDLRHADVAPPPHTHTHAHFAVATWKTIKRVNCCLPAQLLAGSQVLFVWPGCLLLGSALSPLRPLPLLSQCQYCTLRSHSG